MMTTALAKMMTPEIRADILMTLDQYLRETVVDEEIFMIWLEEGVPDGTKNASELLDIEPEEFTDMWNLAERLRNAQAAEDDKDNWD